MHETTKAPQPSIAEHIVPLKVEQTAAPARVVLAGADIPFWDIVRLMVKWAIAAIPATIILAVVVGAVFMVGALAWGMFAAAGSSLSQSLGSDDESVISDTMEHILSMYEADRAKADAAYLNRTTRVHGQVATVDSDKGEVTFTVNGAAYPVTATLSMAWGHSRPLKHLQPGSVVDANCRGAGYSAAGLNFTKCKLVN